jgi:type III secretory pathway lipoprotein EscJ
MHSVVAVVGSRIEAELVVGLLQEHGISARVSADDAGGMRPDLAVQGVRVLVDAEDARIALEILGETVGPAKSRRPLNRFQRWIVDLLSRRRVW